ncbi:MAG: hypothetical protein K2Y22_13860 [Candidatus Obscuribacterales bacterium]|nr:hypothetical protein [Candidatus Obscuribacterales bacterium]
MQHLTLARIIVSFGPISATITKKVNMKYKRTAIRRSHTGAAIAEFAPALALLLLFVFFPLLDLMPILIGYVGCNYLNSQQSDLAAQSLRARGSSFTNQAEVQPRLDTLATDWKSSSLGKLANLNSSTTTIAGPLNSTLHSGYLTCYVRVTTAVQCAPFLLLPFMGPVPGLGAPVNISISSERVVEDATP